MTPFGLDPGLVVSVAWTVLCLLAGMTVPTRYGIRTLNGFGRWVFNKIPTAPPEPRREIEDDSGGGQS